MGHNGDGGTGNLSVADNFRVYLRLENLQTASQLSAEERERAFYLLGYATALAGLMAHACVDISLRFASSGLFFAVFIGVIIALSNPPQEDNSKEKIFFSAPWLLWGTRLVLAGALAYGAWQVLGKFKEISGSMSASKLGDGFLICCAWTVLLGCILGVGYVYLRAAWTSRAARTGLLLAATVPGLVWFYGFFQANHYYSLGVRLVQMGNAEGALSYFTRAVKLNPLLTEYRQYRANTFATIFDLTTQYSPARGDMDKPSNDYERALKDFAWVLKYAPNHTALHQIQGSCIMLWHCGPPKRRRRPKVRTNSSGTVKLRGTIWSRPSAPLSVRWR